MDKLKNLKYMKFSLLYLIALNMIFSGCSSVRNKVDESVDNITIEKNEYYVTVIISSINNTSVKNSLNIEINKDSSTTPKLKVTYGQEFKFSISSNYGILSISGLINKGLGKDVINIKLSKGEN